MDRQLQNIAHDTNTKYFFQMLFELTVLFGAAHIFEETRLLKKTFQDPTDTDSLRECPIQLSQRIPNMRTRTRVILHSLLLLVIVVQVSRPVCVDVPSETEAVVGNPMKLTCISCMKREEVSAETRVDWSYVPTDKEPIPIYLFDGQPRELEGPWRGRLVWNGSKDLQDLSISILNVTMNDTGTYKCVVFRQFEFDCYSPSVTNSLVINLVVREEASDDTTALYSEIMMYVLLVFLTCWLLVEMVYCYRKISKSDEQAQDTATNYLAIPSENKENLGVPVTE